MSYLPIFLVKFLITLTLDTGCDAMVKDGVRRSLRLKNVKRSDGTVKDRDNVDTLKTPGSTKEYQSAIASHLVRSILEW